MSNFYHKVAVASVCTALSFSLGENTKAIAGTFTFGSSTSFLVSDSNQDGLGDFLYGSTALPVGILGESQEFRAFYEFNIANLFLDSNVVISSAIFKGTIRDVEYLGDSRLMAIGYVGNGSPDTSDFSKEGVLLDNFNPFGIPVSPRIDLPLLLPGYNFNVDGTTFVNQIVSNHEPFAGFKFFFTGNGNSDSFITLEHQIASLTITTIDGAEPVPEPTTIFGSAIGLCLGGWLKRKKSTSQNKAKSQA